jgi:aspartyl-tRNA(Asn)/glutamyl-tRNA(Gln) amidotransferase subunit C
MGREIRHMLLGFFLLCGKSFEKYHTTGDSAFVKITTSEIKHVAQLARLNFDPSEIENFNRQLNDILGYISKLEKLDTSRVEPTTHALELTNAFRKDEVKSSFPVEKTLSNAPELEGGGFVVPKII